LEMKGRKRASTGRERKVPVLKAGLCSVWKDNVAALGYSEPGQEALVNKKIDEGCQNGQLKRTNDNLWVHLKPFELTLSGAAVVDAR